MEFDFSLLASEQSFIFLAILLILIVSAIVVLISVLNATIRLVQNLFARKKYVAVQEQEKISALESQFKKAQNYQPATQKRMPQKQTAQVQEGGVPEHSAQKKEVQIEAEAKGAISEAPFQFARSRVIKDNLLREFKADKEAGIESKGTSKQFEEKAKKQLESFKKAHSVKKESELESKMPSRKGEAELSEEEDAIYKTADIHRPLINEKEDKKEEGGKEGDFRKTKNNISAAQSENKGLEEPGDTGKGKYSLDLKNITEKSNSAAATRLRESVLYNKKNINEVSEETAKKDPEIPGYEKPGFMKEKMVYERKANKEKKSLLEQIGFEKAEKAGKEKVVPKKIDDNSIFEGNKSLDRDAFKNSLEAAGDYKMMNRMMDAQRAVGLNLTRTSRAKLVEKYFPQHYGQEISKDEFRRQLKIAEQKFSKTAGERIQTEREIKFLKKIGGIK